MKSTIYALAFLVLSGCASQPQKSLTVYTYPPGATIYGGSGHSTAPATVYYNPDPAYIDSQGCMRVKAITAVWSSGAQVVRPLRLCEAHTVIVIHRPAGLSGLDQDLAMAELLIEREIQRLQEQNALAKVQAARRDAQGRAAMSEGVEALAMGITCQLSGGCSDGQRRNYPVDVRTSCNTDAYGNTYCRSRAW